MIKSIIFYACLLVYTLSFSQTDSSLNTGTIKIAKNKDGLYVKAYVSFDMYRVPKSTYPPNYSYSDIIQYSTKVNITSKDQVINPQPFMEKYVKHFNYSEYFSDIIKLNNINLQKEEVDTLKFIINVLANSQFEYFNWKYLRTRIYSLWQFF